MALTGYERETITVSTSVKQIATAKLQPAGGIDPAREASIFIRSGGPINITVDNSNPSSTVGQGPHEAGTHLIIPGTTNLANLKMIRDLSATADAVVEVELFN